MKKLLVLLVLISCAAAAEIYRSQDEKGEWTFSDRPSPSAERMKLPPLSTYTPTVKSLPPDVDRKEAAASPYNVMVLVEPKNESVIRDQQGEVGISVDLDPLLKTRQGHKIQYYLDDKPHGKPSESSRHRLEIMDRGTHTLGASVLNAAGEVLVSATPVTIYIQRISKLNPNAPAPKNTKPPKSPKPK
ncbi:MAG: DUF4124 domain-containing protein [Gammaproteobacteria bacterium]